MPDIVDVAEVVSANFDDKMILQTGLALYQMMLTTERWNGAQAARIFTPQILKSNLKDGYRLEGM